ncbi:ankyrin repeat-containing domain protein [Nemania sp. FL0031]|nr:ankyrin repeat-containing domain protein [Nemania sp. FL0031]
MELPAVYYCSTASIYSSCSPTSSAIMAEKWERHKATILNLYLIEKTTLNQVISYMQQTHNFDKKKSQYEYQFKKWGVKKNGKTADWRYMSHQLDKTKGRQSKVTMFGIPVSPRKVRREMQRYNAIPTAAEIGRELPSPKPLNDIIIRAQTPPIIEEIVWPTLPWFKFKNKVLFPALWNPSSLLKEFFAAIDSEESFLHFNGSGALRSVFKMSRNPLELHKVVFLLAKMIPEDSIGRPQITENLTQSQLSLSMATETLKLILFNLSNNIVPHEPIFVDFSDNDDPHGYRRDPRDYDKFILHFIEAVSRTNPEILSSILSSRCTTTQAIKEAVFQSAIRGRNYTIISRLLESGVDPNTKIRGHRSGACHLKRGRLNIVWGVGGDAWSCMQEAAFTGDTRLAKILLKAGAIVDYDYFHNCSLLELVAVSSNGDIPGSSFLDFAKLLIELGVLIDHSSPCHTCQNLKLISPIVISLATGSNRMAEFLCEQDTSTYIYDRPEVLQHACIRGKWRDRTTGYDYLDIPTPSSMAIASGIERMAERLLRPILSNPTQVSALEIKQALITSCLVGDIGTTTNILKRFPNITADRQWTKGVTPLAATAWNEDLTIAELLLSLGAYISPKLEDKITYFQSISPIHVAASSGNTTLVRYLLDRGADCNVIFAPSLPNYYNSYKELLVRPYGSPLSLALETGNMDTAKVLLRQSNLIGGELALAIDLGDDSLISDITIKGGAIDILTANYGDGRKYILNAASERGKISIVQSYFSLGGVYRSTALHSATRGAIKSKDYSTVRFLAQNRPVGKIDEYEASALVLSIHEREWSLVSLLLGDPFLPSPSLSFYMEITNGIEYKDIPDSDLWSHRLTPLGWAIHSAPEPVVKKIIWRGYQLHEADIPSLVRGVPDHERAATWASFPLENMNLPCCQALLVYSIALNNVAEVDKCIKLVGSLDFSSLYEDDHLLIYASPLYIAARSGKMELVRLLLDAGASVDFQILQYSVEALYSEDNAKTALEIAVIKQKLDVVRLPLDRGAIVEPSGRLLDGATSLQYCAIQGHLIMARLLILKGADINALPAKACGRTALEGAAEHGRLDMVQLLLEMGAELEGEMRIYYVRSVFLARSEGHFAVANLLVQHGSWTLTDQVLYHRVELCPHRYNYYRYDQELNDWSIRKMKRKLKTVRDQGWYREQYRGYQDWYSVGPSESSSNEIFSSKRSSSDDGSSQGGSDSRDDNDSQGGNGSQDDGIADDNYELPVTFQSTPHYIPQEWLDNLDPDPAELDINSNLLESAPRRIFDSRCMDIDNIELPEDGDVAEIATDKPATNKATPEGHALGQLQIRQQESTTGEEEPDFEPIGESSRWEVANEESLALNGPEAEWEGPFSNFRETDDMNEMFGLLPFRFHLDS